MKLNEKILYCRKRQGLSQEALAEKLGVSRQAVSKWETGDAVPEISKLLALAQNFNVTTDWLLSEEEPEEKKTGKAALNSTWEKEGTEAERERTDRETEAKRSKEAFENFQEGMYRGTVNWNSESAGASQNRTTGNSDWMDELPGFLGKLVRKFGWLAGVYIAVSGAGVTMVGMLAMLISSLMVSSFHNVSNSMFSIPSQSVTVYDSEGNILDASGYEAQLGGMLDEIYGADSNAEVDYYLGSGESVEYYINPAGSFWASNVTASNPVAVLAGFIIAAGVVMMIVGTVFAVVWRKKSLEQ